MPLEPLLSETSDPRSLNDNEDAVVQHLAARLRGNELGLVLGSGVSEPLRVPTWKELVKACCEEVSIVDHGIQLNKKGKVTGERLMALMSRVRATAGDYEGYLKIVEKNLYGKIAVDLRDNPIRAIQTPLMIALGSLLIGSNNGTVTRVVTYNFDGLIEWYLAVHGYDVQAVVKLPPLLREADVTIYHPHGMIPLSDHWERSDEIVFDRKSYHERQDPTHEDPWNKVLENFLYTKQVLIVGLSETDPTLGPLLSAIRKGLSSGGERQHVGVWTFHRKYFSEEHQSAVNEMGCIPLYFADYKDIPAFLLKIRQVAARMQIFA